jgi:ribosomal protein S27E
MINSPTSSVDSSSNIFQSNTGVTNDYSKSTSEYFQQNFTEVRDENAIFYTQFNDREECIETAQDYFGHKEGKNLIIDALSDGNDSYFKLKCESCSNFQIVGKRNGSYFELSKSESITEHYNADESGNRLSCVPKNSEYGVNEVKDDVVLDAPIFQQIFSSRKECFQKAKDYFGRNDNKKLLSDLSKNRNGQKAFFLKCEGCSNFKIVGREKDASCFQLATSECDPNHYNVDNNGIRSECLSNFYPINPAPKKNHVANTLTATMSGEELASQYDEIFSETFVNRRDCIDKVLEVFGENDRKKLTHDLRFSRGGTRFNIKCEGFFFLFLIFIFVKLLFIYFYFFAFNIFLLCLLKYYHVCSKPILKIVKNFKS